MLKAPLLNPWAYISWFYNVIVGPMMTILVQIGHLSFLTFFLILEHFLNLLNPHLLGLSWKTEICRSEDSRAGPFSIRNSYLCSYLPCPFVCIIKLVFDWHCVIEFYLYLFVC